MNNIYSLNGDFSFDILSLGAPMALKGGSFFSKLLAENNSFFVQLPKCSMKQGIVTTGKKTYCDLMFSNSDISTIQWFENLESKVQNLIYEKRLLWFENELDIDDIETAFTSPIRIYKSGRNYLVRCYLGKNVLKSTFCWGENEEPLGVDCLGDSNKKMVPLIEILGVKFSSKSFQIDINLKQVMVISELEFNNCMIKYKNKKENVDENEVQNEHQNEVQNEHQNEVQNEEVHNIEENEQQNEEENEQQNEEHNEVLNEGENIESTELQKVEPNIEVNVEQMDLKNEKKEQDVELNKLDGILEKVELKIEEEPRKDILGKIEEVKLEVDEGETISLKDRNSVYLEMWKKAKEKARLCRQEAIKAYLEAKNIKETYMLDEINSDSESENELEELRI